MAKRRAFVPSASFCSDLELRIAPANVFGLGSWWDKTIDNLGLRHHHDTSNTDIVANAWKHNKATHQVHPILQGGPSTAHETTK